MSHEVEISGEKPSGGTVAPSRAGRLTSQFYAWERRGRGWQTWARSVELEPPFRPFRGHGISSRVTVPDDGRRPTFLSAIADRIRGVFTGTPSVTAHSDGSWADETWEIEPESFCRRARLVELQLVAPAGMKVSRDAAEQFLLSLSALDGPVSFEIVGLPERTVVQFACSEESSSSIRQQLAAYFPDASVTPVRDFLRDQWEQEQQAAFAVADFGLSHEFMLPLRTYRSFEVDPLIGVAGALDGLGRGEVALLQVLFQPTRHRWAESATRAVTDWSGGAFFRDAPETLPLAKAKMASPLFATVVRIAVQSPDTDRTWEIAVALEGALNQLARPGSNELIPLSNAGYDEYNHAEDVLARETERSGMVLGAEELVSLVHPPSASVRAPKLERQLTKTRAAPTNATGHDLKLGENVHLGERTIVTVSPEQRLRHTHVIGASGTGKSHLLLNLITQDLKAGNGVAVLDPHGDLVDQVLERVPEERVEEVLLFDPSDAEWPVGFNVLSAHSAPEKDLLGSDMVAVFRRLSTSWGDQMTAVLANAVLAFLQSSEGGTLRDLSRFLVEPGFRKTYLRTVTDPDVVFFWEKEFPLLSRSQAPLVTRLNTFVRHRLVRHVVAQRENRLDFAGIMNDGRVFLAKLAQGAIGEENAHLLGTLLVSKFHQIALSRQEIGAEERRPFHVYIDEFHNFATPSLSSILTSARKYGLGLVLAHHDFEQLRRRDPELLSAVLTNPATRVCFRVGDSDTKKLAEGFASFDTSDLQALGVGEAICRIERADWDFNLRTFPHPDLDPTEARARRDRIVALSRERYAAPVEQVRKALHEARGHVAPETAPEAPERPVEAVHGAGPAQRTRQPSSAASEEPTKPASLGKGGAEHVRLQEFIRRLAGSRGWTATIEKPVLDGKGKVDVALERDGQSVACEITVRNRKEYELENIKKCLSTGFDTVAVVSRDPKALGQVEELARSELRGEALERILFVTPEQLVEFLEDIAAQAETRQQIIGERPTTTRHSPVSDAEKKRRRGSIAEILLRASRRRRKKDK